MSDWTGEWHYGYDSNNRLTGATPPSPVPGQPAGGPYGYDWVGNRLNPPAGAGHMMYNAGDQLTSWPGMKTYTYDDAGNLEAVTSGGQTVASYTYTPAGLLNEASFKDHLNNSHTLTHVWDADSNRVSIVTGDLQEYFFVYDTTAGIPAVIEETTPNGTNYYIREPGGALIARLNATDGIRYYHFDELGSTRLLTNSSGEVTDRYTYDAYGSVLSHDAYTGSVNQPYQYVGQLGYYTHYMEPDFGLLQLGVRFYDPEVGRFTQMGSPYAYAADNPLAYAAATGGAVAPAPPKPPATGVPDPPVKGIPVLPGPGAGAGGGAACGIGGIIVGCVSGAVIVYEIIDIGVYCCSKGQRTIGCTALGNSIYDWTHPKPPEHTSSDCKSACKEAGVSEDICNKICGRPFGKNTRNCKGLIAMYEHYCLGGHTKDSWPRNWCEAFKRMFRKLCPNDELPKKRKT